MAEKLTKEKAQAVSGVDTIYWLNQFDSIFRQLVIESENVLNSFFGKILYVFKF